MNEFVPAAFDLFTSNGTAAGYVTVTSNAAYYPGALAWIRSDTQSPRRVRITDLSGTTLIGVRFWGRAVDGEDLGVAPQYGRNDISAFVTADNASIAQEQQVVRVQQPLFAKVQKI